MWHGCFTAVFLASIWQSQPVYDESGVPTSEWVDRLLNIYKDDWRSWNGHAAKQASQKSWMVFTKVFTKTLRITVWLGFWPPSQVTSPSYDFLSQGLSVWIILDHPGSSWIIHPHRLTSHHILSAVDCSDAGAISTWQMFGQIWHHQGTSIGWMAWNRLGTLGPMITHGPAQWLKIYVNSYDQQSLP